MKKSGFLVIGMATAALLLGLVGCGDKPGGGTGGQKVTGDLAFPVLTQLNGDKVVVFGTNPVYERKGQGAAEERIRADA